MYRSQAPLQVCSKSSTIRDNHHQGPVSVLRKHSRFFRPNGSFNISGTCRQNLQASLPNTEKNGSVCMRLELYVLVAMHGVYL